MDLRCASNPKDVKHYTTERLREEFHISGLFTPDNSKMVYSHIDRIITAGFMPVKQELVLEAGNLLLITSYKDVKWVVSISEEKVSSQWTVQIMK